MSVEPERFEVKLTTASEALADKDSTWEQLYCGRQVRPHPHPLFPLPACTRSCSRAGAWCVGMAAP